MDTLDSIDLGTVEGFDIRAELVPDYYDPRTGEFVQLIVIASRSQIDLGSDALASVQYGQGHSPTVTIDPLRDENGTLDTYRADMIDNAVADARMKLTELVDQAVDGSME